MVRVRYRAVPDRIETFTVLLADLIEWDLGIVMRTESGRGRRADVVMIKPNLLAVGQGVPTLRPGSRFQDHLRNEGLQHDHLGPNDFHRLSDQRRRGLVEGQPDTMSPLVPLSAAVALVLGQLLVRRWRARLRPGNLKEGACDG